MPDGDPSRPRVAVIIPLYNGASWIRATLQSVFAQKLRPVEVVAVDDGSTDDSAAVVREFPEVRYFRNPVKGPNLARRFGCDQTTAPLLAFLDQDDLWHPEHLAIHATWLSRRPAFHASHGAELDFREPELGPSWRTGEISMIYVNAWKAFPLGPLLATPSSVVIRRSALDAVGGWPTESSGMTDYFAWLALSANGTVGGGFAGSSFPTVGRRKHAASHSVALRNGRETTERYADSLLAASAAAAERFGKTCGLDAPTLRRRVEIAKVFHGLCCRPLAGEWDVFASEAREMVRLTVGETDFFKKKMAGMLSWMLNGRRTRSEAIALFDRMATIWPPEDEIPRLVFRRKSDQYREQKKGRTGF